MHPGLLAFLGFAAAVTAVLGTYPIVSDLFLRDRSRVSRRVDEEFRSRQRERAQRSLLFKDLAVLNVEAAEEVTKGNSWRDYLNALIEQSGLEVTPRRLFTFMIATGVACGLLGFVLTQGFFIAVVVSLIGAHIPPGDVQHKRSRRLRRLLSQLGATFARMPTCIRAPQTVS